MVAPILFGWACSIFFDIHNGQVNGFLSCLVIRELDFGVFSSTAAQVSMVLV